MNKNLTNAAGYELFYNILLHNNIAKKST